MTTLLDRLATMFPQAKRTTLRRMIGDGRVVVGNAIARRATHPVKDDEQVKVTPAAPDAPDDAKIKPLPFEIVYEDADVVVINKPAGLLTSTVPSEKRPTAWAMLREHIRERDAQRGRDGQRGRDVPRGRHALTHVALIHRLDRDASGLLVFSKNSKAFDSLKLQFREHSVQRVYTAVVEGTPHPLKDRIRNRLVEQPDGKVRSTPNPESGEEAISDYEVIRSVAGISVVRVELHTGRKHQIRAHLSERGHPIVGDPTYGRAPDRRSRRSEPLLLAAVKLVFTQPRTFERIKVECDLPESIRKYLASLAE